MTSLIFAGHILTMSSGDTAPLVYYAGKFGALASGA